MKTLMLILVTMVSANLWAQQPNVAAQREAMKKLEFLVGRWSGPALVARGPGAAIQITQSEDIQMKGGGLVMLVEGTGRDAEGKVVFQALATISYDDASNMYRFRAHNEGRFLDTELKMVANGFEWGYTAGPLTVKNVMKLTDKGEWNEVTESTYGNAPTMRSVDMTLKRQ